MIVGRFLLRFILVPLGAAGAILAVTLIDVAGSWSLIAALIDADRGGEGIGMDQLLLGFKLMLMAAKPSAAMLAPAALGVLIGEVFAIRSWIFHGANGGISAWVGVNIMAEILGPADFDPVPIIVIVAGIVAGFVYWTIAGRKAGSSGAAGKSTS